MINVPFSVYYATKLEAKLWETLYNQRKAYFWQTPDWRDRVDTLGIVQADPNDMEANPYRKWCASHNLPLGTEVEFVSTRKYKAALLLTLVIEPIKHIAGVIESIVRLPLSLLLSIGECTGKALCLDRICPMSLKTFLGKIQDTVQSPSDNLDYLISNTGMAVLMIFAGPCNYSGHAEKISQKLFSGFYKHFERELGEMDGSYVPLWKIYKEFSKP